MTLFETLTFPAIIVGAAVDSINPCAIGVLIFLMAYLVKVFKKKSTMLFGGFIYISTVYITYFIAGLGLLTAIQNLTLAYFFYWFAIFISFTSAALEVKDYFWYGKGLSLQLFPGGAERIKIWAGKIQTISRKNQALALLAIVGLGFGAAAFELPCTGQVYLTILALIRSAPFSQGIPLLLFYNLIFVAPLIIVTVLMVAGMSSKRLEAWRKGNRKYMRLIVGVFLYFLGVVLLWYVYNEFTYSVFIRELTFLLVSSQAVIISYILYKGFFD